MLFGNKHNFKLAPCAPPLILCVFSLTLQFVSLCSENNTSEESQHSLQTAPALKITFSKVVTHIVVFVVCYVPFTVTMSSVGSTTQSWIKTIEGLFIWRQVCFYTVSVCIGIYWCDDNYCLEVRVNCLSCLLSDDWR